MEKPGQVFEIIVNCADLFTIKIESSDLASLLSYFHSKSDKVNTEDVDPTPQKLIPSNLESFISIEGLPESITLASGGYFNQLKAKLKEEMRAKT